MPSLIRGPSVSEDSRGRYAITSLNCSRRAKLTAQLEDLQPSESKPGVLKARLQYLDTIIASGATDREVEVKIEPSEETQPVPNIEEGTKEKGDQAMDIDQEKVVSPVKEETMDLEVKPHAERAGSPLAPYVPPIPCSTRLTEEFD